MINTNRTITKYSFYINKSTDLYGSNLIRFSTIIVYNCDVIVSYVQLLSVTFLIVFSVWHQSSDVIDHLEHNYFK